MEGRIKDQILGVEGLRGWSILLMSSLMVPWLLISQTETGKFDITEFSLDKEKTNVFIFHLMPTSSRFVYLI